MKRAFCSGLAGVLVFTVLAVGGSAQTAPSAASPRVVFVCEHGAAKRTAETVATR